MRWRWKALVLVALMSFSGFIRAIPINFLPAGNSSLEAQCEAQFLRFDSLVNALRFVDAQRFADSLQKIYAADTGWHHALFNRWVTSLLSYVERREGRQLAVLESAYRESARRLCVWAYCRIGLTLARVYTQRQDPAVALMYARAVLQEARERGDSMVVRGALLQSLINYWQLDSHGKADSILLELQRWKKGNDDHVLLLPHALQLIERKAWGPALVLLDTLRNSYYRAGRILLAGRVAQVMSMVYLQQGEARRALPLLLWVDSLPSQRTPARKIFASWIIYGDCYVADKDYRLAESYFLRALNDADILQAPFYRAKAMRCLGNVYMESGDYPRALEMKRRAISLQDSITSLLSVKLFRSGDNIRLLQEKKIAYDVQFEEQRRRAERRSRREAYFVGILIFIIGCVLIVLYRLYRVLREIKALRGEKQLLTDRLKQQASELKRQGGRLERMYMRSLQQASRLSLVHAAMHEKSVKAMQSVVYASSIHQALLPTEQERNAICADNFFITRALQLVSGDLFWIGKYNGLTVLVLVDCTGYGISGASLSFIVYMLLYSVVLERGVCDPPSILHLVYTDFQRLLMQVTDKCFRSEANFDLIVMTLDEKNRRACFSGAGEQIFYSLDGRTVQCLSGKTYSLEDSNRKKILPPSVTVQYEPGSLFYLMTRGFMEQRNPDCERLGLSNVIAILEQSAELPMREQRQEILNALARFRLAEEQTDDIMILGMRMA